MMSAAGVSAPAAPILNLEVIRMTALLGFISLLRETASSSGMKCRMIFAVACLIGNAGPIGAQEYQWQIDQVWAHHQMSDLECGESGPCAAAGSFEGDIASIVRLTEDGGLSWRDLLRIEQNHERYPLSIASVHITPQRTLFIGCSKGMVAVSTDKGATWDYRRVFDTGHVTTIRMIDEVRGLAYRNINNRNPGFAIAVTDDAWQTSRNVNVPQSVSLNGVPVSTSDPSVRLSSAALLGHNTVVAVYRQNTQASAVVRTADGGLTWTETSFGVENMRSVRFADSLHGWISGGRTTRLWYDDWPAIFRTTDAGVSWTLCFEGPAILDLNVRGTQTVLAVANEWQALYSTDGGMTWRIDSARIRGPQSAYCALPDGSDGIIVTGLGDVLLPNRVSAISNEVTGALPPTTSVSTGPDGTSLIIDHAALRHILNVALYDIRGGHVASLPASSLSPTRSAARLPDSLAPGVYAVVITIDGEYSGSVDFVHR